jgi:hypothetical protein
VSCVSGWATERLMNGVSGWATERLVNGVSAWTSEGVRARLGRFWAGCVTDERAGAGRRQNEWLVWVSGWASE